MVRQTLKLHNRGLFTRENQLFKYQFVYLKSIFQGGAVQLAITLGYTE